MKQFLIGICVLGMMSSTFAQSDLLFKKVFKKEQIPTVILRAVDVDFPSYQIVELAEIPVEFLEEEEELAQDLKDIETYEIALEGKNENILATYGSNGKLLSVVEHLKDVKPPLDVARALVTEYPGWTISKDAYHMTHFASGKEKERYRFVMTKDGKKKHVSTDGSGHILRPND